MVAGNNSATGRRYCARNTRCERQIIRFSHLSNGETRLFIPFLARIFPIRMRFRIIKSPKTESFLDAPKKKTKNIFSKKWRISGGFSYSLNFLKIIFEIPLDFFRLWAHTKRAFKLRQQNKRHSTPEILRFTEQTVWNRFWSNTQTLWIKAAHQKFKKGCADSWFWNIQTLTKSKVHILDR